MAKYFQKLNKKSKNKNKKGISQFRVSCLLRCLNAVVIHPKTNHIKCAHACLRPIESFGRKINIAYTTKGHKSQRFVLLCFFFLLSIIIIKCITWIGIWNWRRCLHTECHYSNYSFVNELSGCGLHVSTWFIHLSSVISHRQWQNSRKSKYGSGTNIQYLSCGSRISHEDHVELCILFLIQNICQLWGRN